MTILEAIKTSASVIETKDDLLEAIRVLIMAVAESERAPDPVKTEPVEEPKKEAPKKPGPKPGTNPKEALEWYERKRVEARAMADRDCNNCKYHKPDGCSRWECEYEPRKVEVVRCKDCIHWFPHTQCGFDEDNDEYHDYCGLLIPDDDYYAFRRKSDDYCSYGEKREDGEA